MQLTNVSRGQRLRDVALDLAVDTGKSFDQRRFGSYSSVASDPEVPFRRIANADCARALFVDAAQRTLSIPQPLFDFWFPPGDTILGKPTAPRKLARAFHPPHR